MRLLPAGRKVRRLIIPVTTPGIRLFDGGPWAPWIPSKQNTHAPAANEAEDSGIVAIPHLSRDLIACYDGNGSNFGTHPQNVLRGMIYDTKTWEYPYLYNLIDQYQ